MYLTHLLLGGTSFFILCVVIIIVPAFSWIALQDNILTMAHLRSRKRILAVSGFNVRTTGINQSFHYNARLFRMLFPVVWGLLCFPKCHFVSWWLGLRSTLKQCSLDAFLHCSYLVLVEGSLVGALIIKTSPLQPSYPLRHQVLSWGLATSNFRGAFPCLHDKSWKKVM